MKKVVIIFTILLIFVTFILFTKNKINYSPNIKIFSDKEVNETFTLVTTGDVGLGRYVNYKIIEENDPNYPFVNIASYLKDADLTVINLENPLVKNCPTIVTGFKFCGKSENVNGLIFAGVDAANLANNHTTNYGVSGLNETKKLLESNRIAAFGLNDQIRYLDINGYKVALVGFVELGNNWSELSNATNENIQKLVLQAAANSNVVIAAFHWGPEYTHQPSPSQVKLGHLAIDSGADIVLGNHAHWIQPIEKYHDKYIIYAQGNTVFDQDWSLKTREGVIYKFEYRNGKFIKIDERFTIIENNSQPKFVNSVSSRQ